MRGQKVVTDNRFKPKLCIAQYKTIRCNVNKAHRCIKIYTLMNKLGDESGY